MGTKLVGLNELEKEIKGIAAREVRVGIRQGLAVARKVAVTKAKAASSSTRVRRAIRGGTTALFKARGGGATFVGGGRGNLGFTAIGVPSLRHVPPSNNRRAWFVAYSLEIGNPGESARAQNRGRGKRHQGAAPFMANAVEAAGGEITSAFGAKLKEALKL